VAAATQKIYHIFSDLFRIAAAEHRLIFPLFFELRQPQSEQNMSSFLLMSQVPMEVSQLAFCADCDCCNSRKKKLKILPEFGRDPVARGGSGLQSPSPPCAQALRRNACVLIRRFFTNAFFPGFCSVFRALASARQTARKSGVSTIKTPKLSENGVQAGTSGGERKPLAARPNFENICS